MPACYPDLANPRKIRRHLTMAVVCALCMVMSGCSPLRYYLQAAHGEIGVLRAARPISRIVLDPHTPAPLRRELEQVRAIHRFAIKVLHLPDNGSFRDYADLHRKYALWNVFAARPFSVHLIRWCFPIAGCVPYRGYFSRAQAQQYAAALAHRGDDIYVAGVPTFSTLGWLPDPLLSTEIYRSPAETAGLIFHELAHALLYVPGDPVFNESFAVTVQQTGVRRWLRASGNRKGLLRYARAQRFDAAFDALIRHYRSVLARVYRKEPAGPQLLRKKRGLFLALSLAIHRTARCFGVHVTLPRELNNATLGAMSTYTELVPAFRNILREDGGHLSRFYATVRRISQWPKTRRTRWLKSKLPAPRSRPFRCAASGGRGAKRATPARDVRGRRPGER